VRCFAIPPRIGNAKPVSVLCEAPTVAHSWRTVQLIVEHRHIVLHVCDLKDLHTSLQSKT
jgi:hypothetical protein